MVSIQLFEMDMNISRNIYERESKNRFIATAEKIALYSIIPFTFILLFEAVVKNMILINLANLLITVINKITDKFSPIFNEPSTL